jgi:hypothetical protein
MTNRRWLSIGIAMLVVAGLVSSCSRGPSEEELKVQQLHSDLDALQLQYQALQDARAGLAEAEENLATIEALPENKRSEEQKAALDELPGTIEELSATRDQAFEDVQTALADILNVGLNEFPDDPATAGALKIYSEEAMEIADDTVAKSGDYKKALDQLDSASTYYESINLPVYPPLLERISQLDEMRFITQERFDEVKKNMTMDEVKEIAGVPYYQNIQVDDKRGVETWLYRKREGGAAAIYFKIKSGKVYNKNFDAVKTKVVSD